MAPNDDALLIGGGLILLAIMAMGGGGDGEKLTEIIVIPPDDPQRPMQLVSTSPPQQRAPRGFNEQPKQKPPQHPAYGRQMALQREMSESADNLYSFYQDLERRTKEVWVRITHDEVKRRILFPGTVEMLKQLLKDMNKFISETQAFTERFRIAISNIPRVGAALIQAIDNVRTIWKKFNALLAQSSENRDNKFLTREDMEDLQDELIARLNVDRMEYEFGRGAPLRPSEAEESFGDDITDDFAQGGTKRNPDGTEHLTFNNTDGNKKHQNVDESNTQPPQGTSNNITKPTEDMISSMDPHTIANPGSVAQTTAIVTSSNLNTQNPLENPNGGKKGQRQPTLEIDLTGDTGGSPSPSQSPEEDTRIKRPSGDVDEALFTVTKKEKPDDLETEPTGFTAQTKNEAESIAVAFMSGGLHGGSQLNPKINVDWASEWMKQVDAREYESLKTWFDKQLQSTRSNEIAFEQAELSGANVAFGVRPKQQVIRAKQQKLAALFIPENLKTTKKTIEALYPDYYTDVDHGAWPIWLMTSYGPYFANDPQKNTYENAHKFLSELVLSKLNEAQKEAVKANLSQGAALICMFRHVAWATKSAIILGKRTTTQAELESTGDVRAKKRLRETPGGD